MSFPVRGGLVGDRLNIPARSNVAMVLLPSASLEESGKSGGVEFRSPATIVGSWLAVAVFTIILADFTRRNSLRWER